MRLLYVLRPVLACQWILEKQTQPPMEFVKLEERQICQMPAIQPPGWEQLNRLFCEMITKDI